ncbi:MAG: histidine triad nucleotide-binding protein [Rhodobacterales bacterium]|nr:MAG: histidine triad nucleotide-binding protein [Rhodobacterales bacterium]
MSYTYDDQNIFAKILRGEIPNDTVLETEHTLAFNDITPSAPVHVLVIPKGAYVNFDHFAAEASEAEIVDYARTIRAVAVKLGVAQSEGGAGYRTIANAGPHGGQEVLHLHTHLLGGRPIGRMVARG